MRLRLCTALVSLIQFAELVKSLCVPFGSGNFVGFNGSGPLFGAFIVLTEIILAFSELTQRLGNLAEFVECCRIPFVCRLLIVGFSGFQVFLDMGTVVKTVSET